MSQVSLARGTGKQLEKSAQESGGTGWLVVWGEREWGASLSWSLSQPCENMMKMKGRKSAALPVSDKLHY